ncbi:unnamed protein product [Natator depressus]
MKLLPPHLPQIVCRQEMLKLNTKLSLQTSIKRPKISCIRKEGCRCIVIALSSL